MNKKLSENSSFILETTLFGKYLEKVVRKAHIVGFFVSLVYLYLNNNLKNILRVKDRALASGHYVPEVDIIRRYIQCKHLFFTS